jgi:hypothetical protein
VNKNQIIEALSLSARAGLISGIVTASYGFITKDYTQVIPAVVFSFGTAMGVAGYYDRRLNHLRLN